MSSDLRCNLQSAAQSTVSLGDRASWNDFEQILKRLHTEGIYIHPDQLAEFLLAHGLPVDLRYVPLHLREKAISTNQHYQGDMADLVEKMPEFGS